MEVTVPAIFGAVRGGGVSFWWCLGTRALGRGSPQTRPCPSRELAQRGHLGPRRLWAPCQFLTLSEVGLPWACSLQEGPDQPSSCHRKLCPLSCYLHSWGLAQLVTGAKSQRPPDPDLRGLPDLGAPLLPTASSTACQQEQPERAALALA